MKIKHFVMILILILYSSNGAGKETVVNVQKVDVQKIKQLIIQASIQSYSGNCPCPYNLAKNGSRCGKRSAWSRAGGESPFCYESDITDEMIKTWQEKINNNNR